MAEFDDDFNEKMKDKYSKKGVDIDNADFKAYHDSTLTKAEQEQVYDEAFHTKEKESGDRESKRRKGGFERVQDEQSNEYENQEKFKLRDLERKRKIERLEEERDFKKEREDSKRAEKELRIADEIQKRKAQGRLDEAKFNAQKTPTWSKIGAGLAGASKATVKLARGAATTAQTMQAKYNERKQAEYDKKMKSLEMQAREANLRNLLSYRQSAIAVRPTQTQARIAGFQSRVNKLQGQQPSQNDRLLAVHGLGPQQPRVQRQANTNSILSVHGLGNGPKKKNGRSIYDL